MSDGNIEGALRKVVDAQVGRAPREEDTAFRAIRAKVRGTLIDAHRDLGGRLAASGQGWTEEDDRILDVITMWLDKLRERR